VTIWQDIKAGTIPARLTVDEVYDLTAAGILHEGAHFELIDGEVVPMAAAKADWHSIWESRLTRAIIRALPDDLRLFCEASITFAPDTLTEPDLAVWRKGLMPRSVRGPDLALLIEVADSSLPYDLRVKAPLYARFGVPDYWVVDAVRQTIRIHRAPVDGRYSDVDEVEAHQPVAALLAGVTIRLAELD
jgi:Uma2 family endonuclease